MSVGLILASVVSSSGCASLISSEESVQYRFSARGKLSIAHGDERSSVNFVWREELAGERDQQIDLWGALGRGHSQINYRNGLLNVSLPNREVVSGAEANELVDSVLGADFPVSVLSYWLRFKPDNSGIAYVGVRDEGGKLTAFRQLGWLIELLESHSAQSERLPSRLAISNGHSRLLVVIKNWETF